MTAAQLVSEARSHGIRLYVEHGRLRYRVKGTLDLELRARLVASASEVVDHLLHLPTLDWSDRRHWQRGKKPCRYCHKDTNLRDENGAPSHKVCAERHRALHVEKQPAREITP